MKHFTDMIALRKFVVTKAQSLHCYGLSTFYVHHLGKREQVVLGVNGLGFHLLASDPQRSSIKFVPHKRVMKVTPTSETLTIQAWRAQDDEALDRIEVFAFGTLEGPQVGGLLMQYRG